MERSANGFPLRQNTDGTYDSICPQCFLTVATRKTRGEVVELETLHRCGEAALAEIRTAKREIQQDL
jgi:hypothetical protein